MEYDLFAVHLEDLHMGDVRIAFRPRQPAIEGPTHLCLDPGWTVDVGRMEPGLTRDHIHHRALSPLRPHSARPTPEEHDHETQIPKEARRMEEEPKVSADLLCQLDDDPLGTAD